MGPIEQAARLIASAQRAVAFTGAGMSTESGVPDFRSPGGIWSAYDPDEFAFDRLIASAEARRKYWRFGLDLYPRLCAAESHAGHRALAELARRGRLRCVITQNIDGLHQRAGCEDVIELHGNALHVGCLSCGKRWPREVVHGWLESGVADPRCDACGGLLKPTTISFGQAMPEPETSRAFREARECDLLLTIGSSLVVHPAAALVPTAAEAGARLILINLEPTDYDALAEVVIHGRAGETLARIMAALDAAR